MPKVSIGLPVYNGANYLAQSVDSILEQTYSDFELIISDNASTDATEEICREYATRDGRVRYFRQKRNLGCALNSNFVFHESTGEYFKWISHDDLHAPRFIERCVETLDRDAGAVICCPRGILIDDTGREIRMLQRNGWNYYVTSSGEEQGIRPYDRPRRLDSPDPAIRFRDLILYTNWCLEIYGLARTKCLARTSLHGTYHGTDKRILAELALMGRFALLDETMLFYRQHPVQAQRYSGSAVARDFYLSGDVIRSYSRVPRWNSLSGYCRAVRRARLGPASSIACFAGIGQWLLQPAKWGPLAKEATQSARAHFQSAQPTKARGRGAVSTEGNS